MKQSEQNRLNERQRLDGRRATKDYAQWMFAFGFARLGDLERAEHERSEAVHTSEQLEFHSEFHRLARQAFEYRLAQAVRGEPHDGTLDSNCPEVISKLFPSKQANLNTEDGQTEYQLGRLLQTSAVLEPTRRLDPYVRFTKDYAKPGTERSSWHPRVASNTNDMVSGLANATTLQMIHSLVPPTEGRDGSLASRNDDAGYIFRLPLLLTALGRLPVETIRRVVYIMIGELRPVENAFTSAPLFSRLHLQFIDSLVLAIAGTGPLILGDERPARLKLLHHVRGPVLSWIDAMQ